MRPTLLVTNDFPPRVGGIQSYVYEIASRLPASRLMVLASDHPGAHEFDARQAFPIIRYPASVLLPTPRVTRTAEALIQRHHLTGVWYGAAAPLALMTPRLRQAGISRAVASTHGHEVGWAMMPGARHLLRRIGTVNDVVTFVSRYARRRTASALGPDAALESMTPGVDTDYFSPDAAARARVRRRYGLGEGPVVVCLSRLVARKGQDTLIDVWADVVARAPSARLLIVGDGPARSRLRAAAAASPAGGTIVFSGAVSREHLAAHYVAGDIFAMPCRTRGGGLDVEGLGMVFLEASACGLPVVAGDSGGAPEAVRAGETGVVINGRDRSALTDALSRLIASPGLRARLGSQGRRWVAEAWSWQRSADRLAALLG